MKDDMKFCKDCRHVVPQMRGMSFARCTLRGAFEVNLVTGESEDNRVRCSVMRLESEPCGRDGRLFEPLVAEEIAR